MKQRITYIVQQWPLFLVLLPFFFMLHILNENFTLGLASIALKQSLMWAGISVLLTGVFFLLTRSIKKAALLSALLLAYNFFFGTLHDGLKNIAGSNSMVARYVVLIPFTAVLFLVAYIFLRKSKRNFTRLFSFLNILFVVLLLVELSRAIPEIIRERNREIKLSSSFVNCDTCLHPDVYLLIADEYAGKQELQEVFSFDNTAFEDDLKNRGFYVVQDSRSNYNATVYSMASLFSMDYLTLNNKAALQVRDIEQCKDILRKNNVSQFFLQNGYSIRNNSLFDFGLQKQGVENHFYSPSKTVFSNQFFISRVKRDVGHVFLSGRRKEAIRLKNRNKQYVSDEEVDSLTRHDVLDKEKSPKFIYSHFVRPHGPFLFDRNGKPQQEDIHLNETDRLKKVYPEYLLYTNKRLLSLIDFIKAKSQRPFTIIVASDHGLRFQDEVLNNKYSSMNFCAVYLSTGNYQKLYNGMSLVNLFRTVLNTAFAQKLSLLKDSSIHIKQIKE